MISEEDRNLLEQTRFNYVLSDNLRQAIQNLLKDHKQLHLAYEYYRERHLEFNNGVIEGMKTIEKRDCLHCGSNEGAYCEKCFQELIAENLKLQKKD